MNAPTLADAPDTETVSKHSDGLMDGTPATQAAVVRENGTSSREGDLGTTKKRRRWVRGASFALLPIALLAGG
jgi:hypothetical protein